MYTEAALGRFRSWEVVSRSESESESDSATATATATAVLKVLKVRSGQVRFKFMTTRPMSWPVPVCTPGPPSQVSCLRHIALVFRDVTDGCATEVGHGQAPGVRAAL